MSLKQITEGLPSDLTSQLLSNETVFYFSFIASTGGCGTSGSKLNYGILALRKYIFFTASKMTVKRISDCNPFSQRP